MRKIMDRLLALQKLQFDVHGRAETSRAEIEKLRADIPPTILAHYERFVARGKKGVALARNGVCGECHLRITSAKLVDLSAGTDIQLCDNCGRYLYLPETASLSLADANSLPGATLKRTSRKTAHHAA